MLSSHCFSAAACRKPRSPVHNLLLLRSMRLTCAAGGCLTPGLSDKLLLMLGDSEWSACCKTVHTRAELAVPVQTSC